MMPDDGDHDGVTAQSYGAVQVSEATDECWLIRIPQKLAEMIDAAPEGTDLGELVFTKGGKVPGEINPVKPSFSVHFSEHAAKQESQTTQLPLNYSLQAMTKKIPLMHPFTRDPVNGSVKLLGQVTRTANMQVEQDSKYRAMLKDRLVATNVTSQRFVKPVEATESVISKQQQQQKLGAGIPTSTSNKGFSSAVLEFGKRKLEAQQAQATALAQPQSKKSRQFAPNQSIRSILFELFGQSQYWTVKDLKVAAVSGGASHLATKRAEAEMRDVLREIGDYHRSGDQKNMWELRKEFQHGGAT
jgi:hypothetical protein